MAIRPRKCSRSAGVSGAKDSVKLSRRCGDRFEIIRFGTNSNQFWNNFAPVNEQYPSISISIRNNLSLVAMPHESDYCYRSRGTPEKILFYSLKIQSQPIAGHKIIDGMGGGFAAQVLHLPIHQVSTSLENRDVQDDFCLHYRFSRCITFKTHGNQELVAD